MPLIQVAIIIMLAHVNGYPSVCIRKTSDVNKTFCQDSLNLKTKTKTLFFVLEADQDQDFGLEDYITADDSRLNF